MVVRLGYNRFKKKMYKVYVGQTRFKVLKGKRTKKPIYFKNYQKAKGFANKIKKNGGKAYVKKC